MGGGGGPSGPSAEQLAEQKKQADRIAAQEKKEAKQLSSTKAVIAARSGSGQGITLNPLTGERGVVTATKLGGGTA